MRINRIQEWIKAILFHILILFPGIILAQSDTLSSSGFIHRIGIDARPGYIFPTNRFLAGDNARREAINNAYSAHLRYSFQFQPNTLVEQIYKGAYQGVGLAYFNFGEREVLGNPTALYVFQGARLARISRKISLNYEWNFGLSFGWKPYDYHNNPDNVIIGSKTNAYLNVNLYLNWMLSDRVDLITGGTLSHFSNGNTNFPNAGLNTLDFRIGLVYNFNRANSSLPPKPLFGTTPAFPRHISYDLVLFGSWRRKGVFSGEEQIASPHKYAVMGFNFNPMYNFGYRFRAGVSLDGVYDKSANIYTRDFMYDSHDSYDSGDRFATPPFDYQLALGLSGRAEYVMPYFTVGVGLGVNVLHRGGDFKAIYQILSLKTEITRNSFLHIGYSLNDFHDPNYLMLGIGYRFNSKSPNFYR